tara:strand:+ start:286 stop:873 length:588 start_codon:yes stop_codon:yes gene_type:complete
MNKLVYLTILLYSLSFSEEIWEKEIPPSKYLQKLAIEGEALHKNSLKYISYGGVALGIHGLENQKEPHQELAAYIILITGLVGIIADKFILKNKPRTLPAKEFEKIKNKKGDPREKEAYEILVKLADKSRNAKQENRDNKEKEEERIKKYGPVSAGIQQLASNFMMNRFKENNPQFGMTLYEKVLDNYLNQKPIN